MAKTLKKWQGWLLFGGSMVVVFVLGLLVSSLMERRAEVASVFNNKRTQFTDSIVAQNEKFKADYPREYETWAMTEDTSFESKYNGSEEVDVLEQHPEMVVLWAGYAFSRHYNTPRGHKHALEDMRKILRTGNPGIDGDGDMQPATCWTCKGPDVPRMMRELSGSKSVMDPANFYAKKWSELGTEEMNTIGCSDCHDARTMDLRPARPALYEAWARVGKDVRKATHQEMRSLVCAQCHTEYYFIKPDDPNNPGKSNYLMFPQDKGMTCEAAEEYYDSIGFYDYIHPLSKTPILKAQHPGYEIALQGIHGQRGVSCADCHMPYKQEGGVKFSDHQIMSPLAKIDRTCQTCHRQGIAAAIVLPPALAYGRIACLTFTLQRRRHVGRGDDSGIGYHRFRLHRQLTARLHTIIIALRRKCIVFSGRQTLNPDDAICGRIGLSVQHD